MEFSQILLNAQEADAIIRKQAEERSKELQERDLPKFFTSLACELANDEKPTGNRKLAGIVLKNVLNAVGSVQIWLSLEPTVTAKIKEFLLKTLASPSLIARSTASQVIAKVAGIEFPQRQWPELIGPLLSNVGQTPDPTRQAFLETFGYICEEVSPDMLGRENADRILSAIIQGINSPEINNNVRLASIEALHNALGFAHAGLSIAPVREHILMAIFDATISTDSRIQQAAFECLVAISAKYYQKLAPYMENILNITAKAVREDEEPVALQAIEFWSSICEKEIYMSKRYGEGFFGHNDFPRCFHLVRQALPILVPLLFETLLMQEENQDEEAWNIAMAGGTCLSLVAQNVGNAIVPLVKSLYAKNITKLDWRRRFAAIYAFGSIIEGPSPDELLPPVYDALKFMLTALMKDPNNHVRNTTAWTIARVFQFLHESALLMETPFINQNNCQPVITVLLEGLKDLPSIAEKTSYILYFLAKGYNEAYSREHPSYYALMTNFSDDIINALRDAANRGFEGSGLRAVACAAADEQREYELLFTHVDIETV